MTKQTEALRMAIEALEDANNMVVSEWNRQGEYDEALKACKEALAQPSLTYEDGFAHGYEAHRAEQALEQPAQEPVAWMELKEDAGYKDITVWQEPVSKKSIPLYTHPAPAWQGLSEYDILSIDGLDCVDETYLINFARAIEAKLKEKNT